jgi:hypothetical protein
MEHDAQMRARHDTTRNGGTARQRDGLGWPDDTVSRDKRREWGGGELEISRLLQCSDGGENVDGTCLLPVGPVTAQARK